MMTPLIIYCIYLGLKMLRRCHARCGKFKGTWLEVEFVAAWRTASPGIHCCILAKAAWSVTLTQKTPVHSPPKLSSCNMMLQAAAARMPGSSSG